MLFFRRGGGDEVRGLVAEDGDGRGDIRIQAEGPDPDVVRFEVAQHGEGHVSSEAGAVLRKEFADFPGGEGQTVLACIVKMREESLRGGVQCGVTEAGACRQGVEGALGAYALVFPLVAREAEGVEPGQQTVRKGAVAAGWREVPGFQEQFQRFGLPPSQEKVRRPDAQGPERGCALLFRR